MSFTAQNYIDEIRRLAFDGPLKKLVKGDACTAQLVSTTSPRTKTQFTLSNKNIVDPASVSGAVFQASIDNGAYATATLSDAALGLGTASSAPQKAISFLYYFQFFTDAEVTDMRNNALRQIGSYNPDDSTSWTELAQGLFGVACYYAASEALRVNATAYVKFYDITIGDKQLSKNQMFKNIEAMAKSYEEKAIQLSDYYYRGQDRQKRPAYARSTPCYPGNRQQPIR